MKRILQLGLCLLYLLPLSVVGQVLVEGKVSDADSGEELIGVTIREKGSTTGTVTDIDGNYSMEVPAGSTLIFSYTGMQAKEVQIDKAGRYDIELSVEASQLEQVVVVGYGTKKAKDIAGSVSQVNSARLEKRNLKSVPEALQGEVAGIQITNNGQPGNAAIIRIRGYNTLNNNRPLILVDGIEVSRLFTVDPNDIESVSVLKDAASAAIYGNRASNGVILITTKKGLREKQGLTYRSYFGWQEATNTIDMLNAEQYVNLINEAASNAGRNPIYNASEVAQWAGEEGTNWQDAVLRQGFIQNHHLNFTGGSKNSIYSASLGYLDQEGIYIETDFVRYNAKITNETTFKDKLKIGTNLNLNYSVENAGGDFYISRTFMMPPTVPVRFEDGSYGYDPKGATNGILKNPVAMSELITWQKIQNHFFGNAYADYEFFPGLNFRTNLKVDRRIEEKDYFEPQYQLGTAFQEAFADVADFKEWTWEWDNVLTFKRNLANKHSINLVLGTSARKHFSEFFLAKGFGFPSEFVRILDLVGTQNRIIVGSNTGYRTFGAFTRLDYNFKEKYFFTGTLRYDGSSRFAPGNRYGSFPSFGGAWRISEEPFLKGNDVLSELKVRASWGLLGNAAIGDFEYQSLVDFGLNYVFGGAVANGGAPINLANEDIKWETTEQIDIGVDLGFFDDKLSLKADYFIKNTTDILFNVPLPATSGAANSPRQNIGEFQNKGIELELKVDLPVGQHLYISAGGNIAFIQNELIDLDGISFTTGREGYSHIFREGESFRALYGYRTAGIFQNESQLNSLPHWKDAAPGDLIFVDINGDGKITPDDRTVLGRSIPDFTYGFNLDIAYKGFDLTALVQGVHGNGIVLANANFGGGRGFFDFWENIIAERSQRWHGEGTSNTDPRLYYLGDPGNNEFNSDYWIQDGSFLRLKNIQLGYTFPKTWFESAGISRFRIYGGGTNILTITNFSGFDPELAAEQSDSFGWNYPMAKTFIVGLDLDF